MPTCGWRDTVDIISCAACVTVTKTFPKFASLIVNSQVGIIAWAWSVAFQTILTWKMNHGQVAHPSRLDEDTYTWGASGRTGEGKLVSRPDKRARFHRLPTYLYATLDAYPTSFTSWNPNHAFAATRDM